MVMSLTFDIFSNLFSNLMFVIIKKETKHKIIIFSKRRKGKGESLYVKHLKGNFITHSNALNTKPIYKHYTFNFCVFNLIKRRINIESSFVNTLNYIHTIIADLHLENILDEEDLVEIEKFTANKTIILFIYSLILCIKSGK